MARPRGVGLATRGYGATGKGAGGGESTKVSGYMRGGAVKKSAPKGAPAAMPTGKTGRSSFKMQRPQPMGDAAPTMGGDMGDQEMPAMKKGGRVAKFNDHDADDGYKKGGKVKGYKKGGLIGETKSGESYGLPAYAKNHKGVGYKVPDKGKMTKDARKLSKKGCVEPPKSNGA